MAMRHEHGSRLNLNPGLQHTNIWAILYLVDKVYFGENLRRIYRSQSECAYLRELKLSLGKLVSANLKPALQHRNSRGVLLWLRLFWVEITEAEPYTERQFPLCYVPVHRGFGRVGPAFLDDSGGPCIRCDVVLQIVLDDCFSCRPSGGVSVLYSGADVNLISGNKSRDPFWSGTETEQCCQKQDSSSKSIF